MVTASRSTWTDLISTKRGHTEDNPRAITQPAAHPAAQSQNGRSLPALRSGRVCNGRSPPTPSRAWRPRAPDEGRCRADPHCTHNGDSRYCRNDHRYFHIERPGSRVGPRDQHPVARCACPFAQVRVVSVCPTENGARRHNDTTSSDNDDDHTTTGRHPDDNTSGAAPGPGNRCQQRLYRRLGVHPDARVG
jgi:hypothetical protein